MNETERGIWRKIYGILEEIAALKKEIIRLESLLATKENKKLDRRSPYDLSRGY